MASGSSPSTPPAHRGRALAWVLGAAGAVVALLLGIGAVGAVRDWLPDLSNPFAEETTDRSQPALLRSIRDLSRFVAASGDFEVVIDVETSRRFIPDTIFGERTLFVAAGTVDAYVEFGGLADDALEVNNELDTVTVSLPAPELAPPNIDSERSYVFAQQRGVVNRFADFFGNDADQYQQVLQLAEQRIAQAAQESELRDRAADNTQRMLEGMLRSLGFAEVTVTFTAP